MYIILIILLILLSRLLKKITFHYLRTSLILKSLIKIKILLNKSIISK